MREVKPTQKPVPSSDIKDLFFNSGLLDIWATSLEHKYIDRFGNCHLTAAGMEWLFKELVEKFKVDMNVAIVAAGYITIDSFQQGADLPNNELTQRNHILRDETTGEYYRWDGDLPKQVLAGSTPQSTGGIGKGAWVSVGDASLRTDISSKGGASVVKWRNHSVGEILDRVVYSSDFYSLEDFSNFPAGKKVIVGGEYNIDKPLVFNDDVLSELSTQGKVKINCSEPMVGVTIGSELTDKVGTLNAVASGATDITLTATPLVSISSGDVLFIHNPVDFSFSQYRAYYRQGESVTVKSIAGTKITLMSGVIDSYPANCTLIKPLFRKIKVSGDIQVVYPIEEGQHKYSAKSLAVLISQLHSSDTSGLKVSCSQGAYAVIARHCVDTSGVAMSATQELRSGTPTLGLDYGINIANCQNVNFQGSFAGERHGSCTSGSGLIVNRFCVVSGEIRATGVGEQAAADWHGNSEFCTYGGYMQGLTFGGDNNTVTRGSIIDGFNPSSNRPTVMGSELLGLNFDFSGVTINSNSEPHIRYYGVVDVGGNTNELTASTRRGGKLTLDGAVINSPKAEQAVKLRNRGSDKDFSFSGNGMLVKSKPSTRPIEISAISGAEFKTISLSNPNIPVGSELIVKRQTGGVGISKYGSVDITIPSGRSEVTVNISTGSDFYVDTPIFSSVEVNGIKSGESSFSYIANVISSDSQKLRVRVKTTAGANVSSDTVLVCSYMAMY